jgi:transcriptional regulator with XRE-family HTH domain
MSSPSEILKRAREQSGKVPEEVARLAGIGKNKYYDLEAYDDEIETNTSIKELRDICVVLNITIHSLFFAAIDPSEQISPEQLIDRLKNHLQQTKTSIEGFEDGVEWSIRSTLDNPSEVWSWDTDCLRAVCGEIGVNWIHAL